MSRSESFVEFIRDQLEGLRGFEMKRMFGGYGLYLDGLFFGILVDGKLYFKTSEETIQKYINLGSMPFTYLKKDSKGKKKKVSLRRYYEVPLDILENQSELKRWAKEVVA